MILMYMIIFRTHQQKKSLRGPTQYIVKTKIKTCKKHEKSNLANTQTFVKNKVTKILKLTWLILRFYF